MESSRLEIMECEKEITSIKNSLKSLNLGASTEGEKGRNSLKVSVHKVKFNGGEDTPPCTFKAHLSSPIEERGIVKIHDPLNPMAEESFALFESVETANALLTIEVFTGPDSSEKLGVSAAHDLMPLCEDMELVSGGDGSKSLMVDFAIVPENREELVVHETIDTDVNGKSEPVEGNDETGKEKAEINEETPEDAAEETKPSQDSSEEGANDSKVQVPVCIVSVHLEYTPSVEDKRDALYDQLNEVSKRKAAAIESLRKSASVVNHAKSEEGSASENKKSAVVKSGFLNKSKGSGSKTADPPFWKRWYDKTIGPKSMLWIVGPVAKNYVIFFAVSAFFHYKGDLLALPPPV